MNSQLCEALIEQYIRYFASHPNTTYNVETKVAKGLLLRDLIHYNGNWFRVRAKNLGAGVYQISRIKP